jgi:hypothetical protein
MRGLFFLMKYYVRFAKIDKADTIVNITLKIQWKYKFIKFIRSLANNTNNAKDFRWLVTIELLWSAI